MADHRAVLRKPATDAERQALALAVWAVLTGFSASRDVVMWADRVLGGGR